MNGARRPRLAVIGSLNADLTLLVERLPGPGETVLSSAPGTVGFGGKGGNQAAAAAAFGADVTMIARVGDDDVGERICGDLRSRGVNVSQVRTTPGARSGGATIAVDSAGENLILVDPGANGALVPGDIDPDALEGAGAVLLQLEIPLATVAAAASKASAPVVLNPAPAVPLGPDLLADVDVQVPNRTELALLAGGGTTVSRRAGGNRGAGSPADSATGSTSWSRRSADGALVVPGSGGGDAHRRPGGQGGGCHGGGGLLLRHALAVLLAEGVSLADAARISVCRPPRCRPDRREAPAALLPGRDQARSAWPAKPGRHDRPGLAGRHLPSSWSARKPRLRRACSSTIRPNASGSPARMRARRFGSTYVPVRSSTTVPGSAQLPRKPLFPIAMCCLREFPGTEGHGRDPACGCGSWSASW